MAKATIFPISKPIVLNHQSGGFLVFVPNKHAFGYRIFPDPGAEIMKVDLLIVDKKSGAKVWEIDSFEITENGFPTGQFANADEIQSWETTVLSLKSAVTTKADTVDSKRVQEREFIGRLAQARDVRAGTPDGPERVAMDGEIETLVGQLSTAQNELAASELAADSAQELYLQHSGQKPTPVPQVVNRYSDIIGYFNGDGSITKEGIEWAAQIPLFGETLGSFLLIK